MEDGKTIKILDIMKNKKYRIFTKIVPVDVTPTEWFKAHKIPTKHRFSFTITPMDSDTLDMMRTYKEQSDYEVSLNRAMAKLGLGVLDVWKFKDMEEFRKSTPEEQEQKLDDEVFTRLGNQQEEDLGAKVKSKKMFSDGKNNVIKTCTKYVFIGDDKMKFTESEFEGLDQDLKDFLYNSILDESHLNKEDELALR